MRVLHSAVLARPGLKGGSRSTEEEEAGAVLNACYGLRSGRILKNVRHKFGNHSTLSEVTRQDRSVARREMAGAIQLMNRSLY